MTKPPPTDRPPSRAGRLFWLLILLAALVVTGVLAYLMLDWDKATSGGSIGPPQTVAPAAR